MPESREHEVVVYGATGFTGGLTAEYMARHAPGARWAIGGRTRSKLESVRSRLAEINPELAELPLIEADTGDPAALRAMAESTQVLITTVGPYINYGEPVVAACAAAGTDYVDLTGEPEFVDRMWLAYHEQAERSGARLVHSCGFDSIPHDLGVLYTVEQLPEGVPLKVEGFVRAGGTISGGTYHSALHIMGRLWQGRQVAGERAKREPRPSDRRVHGLTRPPRQETVAGGWILPVPTIDPIVVLRSARALDRYGPDFSYGHYFTFKRLPMMAGLAAGAGGMVALAQVPLTRNLLMKLKDAGDGPSPEQREKAWFKVRFLGEAATGERVVTEVSGGDPGYGETAKMLAESALCLARDDLPPTRGQVTPAVAMGDALIKRLSDAGIGFSRIE